MKKLDLDCSTNSPCQRLRECMENSMENIHTDLPLDWVPFRHKWDFSDNSIVSRVERNDLITKSALLKNSSLFLLAHITTIYSSCPKSVNPVSLLSSIQFIFCDFGEFGLGSTYTPLLNILLYSHHLSAWYCIDVVKRNYVLVSYGR